MGVLYGIEYRKDRNRWGFRISRNGRTLRRYCWRTKEEAEEAFREVKKLASLPPTALREAARNYLLWLWPRRSKQRYDDVHEHLCKWIIPFFGAKTLVTYITIEQVEDFIAHHKNVPHQRLGKDGKVVSAKKVSLMTI
jgi:hypothetical protein